MSEMVERVAKAMHEFNAEWVPSLGSWDEIGSEQQEIYLGRARATIVAMREPTDEMTEIGRRVNFGNYANEAWRAMLDEALDGSPQPAEASR